ncbi:type II secretion system protein [Candidatus Sumerlaeota bacterium]|nr:type II secretion system protein [Candidatus Sumerlaeota bacterium]
MKRFFTYPTLLRLFCRYRKGVTLIELLVAITISGIFLAGVMETFVYILQSSEDAEAKLEAVTNARSALDTMSQEIKTARIDPRRPIQFFYGSSVDLPYGDAIDDDLDGRTDEEIRDGHDNDGDYAAVNDDLHIQLDGGVFERGNLINSPDLGDRNIDEDCRFSNDTLEFITFPDPNNPGFREKNVKYQITTFDGQPNVLVRRVIYNPHDPDTRYEEQDPIAFNVLSISFLYWDPNRFPMDWLTAWDSLYAPMFPDPQIELPAAVHVALTVYSGAAPFQEYSAGQRVDAITLQTIVNIEQVLKDERYQNLK